MQFLMCQQDNQGWKGVYKEIHQIIFDEYQNQEINVIFEKKIVSGIMQKIESRIKDLNNQFANFGVILNNEGMSGLYYYAIFTIWRILCFRQWKQIEGSINETENQKVSLLQKLKNMIQNQGLILDNIRAQFLVENILNQSTQLLQIEYTKEAINEIRNYSKESSYDIIYNLDKQILKKENKTITDQQILEYIRNQTNYIKTYVKQKSIKIQQDIQQKLTQKFRNDLRMHLTKVLANTQNLDTFVVQPLKAQDYFIQLDNQDLAPGLLYKIVLSCLQGQVSQQLLDMIKPQYRDAFSTDDFHVFQIPLYPPIQSSSDAEIQILFDFVKAFQNKINLQIKGLEQLEIDLQKLNLQSELDALELKQIGCSECCPICKRKCDQEIADSTHQHQCRNGHQLRGMSGVLIECYPSLYTCEEIQDDFLIQELGTGEIKQWKDIKAIYNNWRFSCLTKEELQSSKDKFMMIWNYNIGQMICKQLTQELGQDVFYVQKQLVDLGQNKVIPKTIHYIFMLDDSGSMSGCPFNYAKAGLIEFLHQIQKNPNSRISIIIFNSDARCVVDCEPSNPVEQGQKLIQAYGGKDYNEAFLLVFKKIKFNPEFQKFQSHQIYCYTDGSSAYPTEALNRFKELDPIKKSNIEFFACTEESQPSTLIKIVEFFNKECFRAEMTHGVRTRKTDLIYKESISQCSHKLKHY